MQGQTTCEACVRGYRLADDGIHYNDDDGGATWGICRKVVARDHAACSTLAQKVLETVASVALEDSNYNSLFVNGFIRAQSRIGSALVELFQKEGIDATTTKGDR